VRVSPRDLHAVQRAGMLARYALLGPVAFVHVDLPATGTAGTGLDDLCVSDHHALVIRGSMSIVHEDGQPADRFEAGTAFYVPGGPPGHRFESTGPTRLAGFSAVAPDLDTGAEALRSRGFEPVRRSRAPLALPSTVTVQGGSPPFRRRGAVDVEGSVMGDWLFMRSVLGPQSGYTSTWCEVSHWGLVLDGDMTINLSDDVELVSTGDAFYAPPGHRFESSDGATIVDYTPISELDSGRSLPAWRKRAVERLLGSRTDAAERVDITAVVTQGAIGPAAPSAHRHRDGAPARVDVLDPRRRGLSPAF
jgi:mannose-6-phosphate isomerase-like protein (cupin superfamily)